MKRQRFLKEGKKSIENYRSPQSQQKEGLPMRAWQTVQSTKTKLCSPGICTKESTHKFEIQDDFSEFTIVKAILGSELNF